MIHLFQLDSIVYGKPPHGQDNDAMRMMISSVLYPLISKYEIYCGTIEFDKLRYFAQNYTRLWILSKPSRQLN